MTTTAPTVTRGQATSFTDTANLIPNIAQTLDMLTPMDVPTLSMLGWGKEAPKDKGAAKGANTLSFPCNQLTHTWLNDDTIPNKVELNAAYAVADPYLDVGVTASKFFNVNDILFSAQDTDFRVTSVDTTLGRIYVTVINGSTDAAVANGGLIYRLWNATTEGAVGTLDGEEVDVEQRSNYVQNFDASQSITFTAQTVKRYGINDNKKRLLAELLRNRFLQFELSLIYNRRSSAAWAARTDKIVMGGLRHYIRLGTPKESAMVLNAAGATLNETSHFEACTRAIYLAGGEPDIIMVPPIQKSVIDDWNLPYTRLEGFSTNGVFGGMVSRYRNSFFDGKIVINRHLRPTDIIILTKKFVGVGPMKGHPVETAYGTLNDLGFHLRLLADRGNTSDWYLSGSYTMEVRNADRAHGWIYGLATS